MTEETKRTPRAELGVDGNAGFALIGDNIQSGEAEFVEIALPLEASKDPYRYHSTKWCNAASRASTLAYRALQKRLGCEITYWIGPSHSMQGP